MLLARFHSMTNRFSPPEAEVADPVPVKQTTWRRTVGAVVLFSLAALVLAWFVAPLLAALLMQLLGVESSSVPTEFLVLDVAFSTAVFFVGCHLAARMAHGHGVAASIAVGAIGTIVYFLQAGGADALANSEFPLWYTFFPTHVLPAALVALAERRREN
jgi:hypothetical protein